MSKVCINIAWPYANGKIHLGHVAGSLLPPDIFSRYNRLLGNEVLVVGGSDQHGTPITVTAEKEKTTPQAVAEKYHEINKKAIEDLSIEYSLFNKTYCKTHYDVVQKMFLQLLDNGFLYTKQTDQYYCEPCGRFLPDRYVEGICPVCSVSDVRSDQCDSCGTTFETGELKEPHCIQCGNVPEVRNTEHYFLKLSAFRDRLLDFMSDKVYWRSNVKTFTTNWLTEGLHDRAITRDMSWGVPVPVEGWDDKVIYVWFDAVIGYLSASIEYSNMIGKPDYWKDYWMDPEVKHYYFIGKDNIPFHSIIWPAMLMGVGELNLPYDIPANEYLMFGGGKLSKSRGGAIDVPSVLKNYDADLIRYYLSMNMPDTHDSDFSWEDFRIKINNELVSDLGNFYHRCLSFTHKNFGKIPEAASDLESADVLESISSYYSEYQSYLSKCDFKKALKVVMSLAHYANKFFNDSKPWALVKSDKEACGRVMNTNLRIVKALAIMAWPFMPKSSEKIWEYLGIEETVEECGYKGLITPLTVGTVFEEPMPVYKKVEFEEEKKIVVEPEPEQKGPFVDFRKLDLKAGTIVNVQDHPDADKLYLMNVDVGEELPRQIVAGLKAFYSKDDLIDRKVIVVTNLKPAKLRGILSSGMLLAADDEDLGGTTVLLLTPSVEVPNGTKFSSGMESSTSRIDYKDFLKVTMKVSAMKDGMFVHGSRKIVTKENYPSKVVAVIDENETVLLSDGNGSIATVDRDIMDGAGVR
ncbi:MAG TPA: methionine--tRNA ligase [Candidatus Methanomethylophilaceae archaeon]|nr:methionine--tRNA ligase [Candidatus Methanomethylophilaceae archaeon]